MVHGAMVRASSRSVWLATRSYSTPVGYSLSAGSLPTYKHFGALHLPTSASARLTNVWLPLGEKRHTAVAAVSSGSVVRIFTEAAG